MSKEKDLAKRISRRQFVKGAAVGAGALAAGSVLASCRPEVDPEVGIPETWDEEADVVIIGAGGAGIVAAIEVAEAGASVLVLEKAPVVGGTTAVSGGVIQGSNTVVQRAVGIDDDSPEKHFQYWMMASEEQADRELVRLMADNSGANIQWLIDQGMEFVEELGGVSPIPYMDSDLMVDRIHRPGVAGEPVRGDRFVAVLYEAAQDKGAEFLLETSVVGLVRHPENGVIGVRAESEGQEISVKANRAVILATSSFDYNEEMARAFSLQQWWALKTGSCECAPTNTGDGIKMAMEIGADLAGMGGTICTPRPSIGQATAPGVWVNLYGQRFVNEAAHYAFATRAVFHQEQSLAYAIFDDKVREEASPALGWSDDLSDEIAAGVVTTGETLAALAQTLGVNAAELEATVEKWNEDVEADEDTLYGKTVGLQAIDEGPYYASQIVSRNLGSHGGVRINTDAQVLDVRDEVIPRLYAGGMVAGGYVGAYYPGSGTAIAGAVCFGRIAGQEAATEEAWS